MTKLKPCPFCGCDMNIETVAIDYFGLVGHPRHRDGCMIGTMPCANELKLWLNGKKGA